MAHREEFNRQRKLNKEGVEEIIEQMDENGDGLLSQEELFSRTTQTDQEKTADERMFNFADGEFGKKDGQLDADELFVLALPQYTTNREG